MASALYTWQARRKRGATKAQQESSKRTASGSEKAKGSEEQREDSERVARGRKVEFEFVTNT